MVTEYKFSGTIIAVKSGKDIVIIKGANDQEFARKIVESILDKLASE